MTLNSIKYVLFLAAVAAVYFLLPKKHRVLFLLLASYGFYALWQPAFCLLLLAATLVSWLCAAAFSRKTLGWSKAWIVLGAVYLFGVLLLYKYLDFFCNSVLSLLGRPADYRSGLLLPLGISFYTFSASSYLFDVGRGKQEPERSFVRYALYVSFFPAILSGPINRAGLLLPQIRQPKDFSYEALKKGLLRFALGAVKKCVLADTLAILVNKVYASFDSCSGVLLALAVMAYVLQVYFDFSGYTDMALGSAQILGFELPENFNAPFLACSLKDMWQRWHMSLFAWLREYVYFPLGGGRCPKWRKCLNILIVFSLSGLWHGAGGTFLMWGLLNGIYRVVDMLVAPLFTRQGGKRKDSFVRKALGWLRTMVLFCLAAVFFRAETTAKGFAYVWRMLTAFVPTADTPALHSFLGYRQLALCLLCLAFFALDSLSREHRGRALLQGVEERSFAYWLTLAGVVLFVAVFGLYGAGFDASSFVYFQF